MKIDLKLIILWIASLALFVGVGIAILLAPSWLSGVQGLTIRFFLGYCGIIVVAQVLSGMEIIRRLREDSSWKNNRDKSRMASAGVHEIK